LFSAASFEFERREVGRDLQFFALVDDVSGDGHWVVILAEVRGIHIVDLKQILDQTE
jgi:hypothetical protein